MSQPAAGQALSVQQTSAAVQQSNSWEETLQEFQAQYGRASEMHQLQYCVGKKHRNRRYELVYADRGYVCWVKAHVKEADATKEQLQFLHYIQLQEREAGAAPAPEPAEEPAEDPAEDDYELLEQEAGAVTMEQLAVRMGQVEQDLQGLMERLQIS